MPLPFILAGAAILAGVAGAGGLISAKEKNDQANEKMEEAKEIFDRAQRKLHSQREETTETLDELGKLKLIVWQDELQHFLKTFKKIKNVSLEGMPKVGQITEITFQGEQLQTIENVALRASEIVSGGFSGLAAGSTAGVAVYGGVMFLGTASTGTAIGSLAGAAATNATLAWLGGGSLAAGGWGVAGGTAALGGIVLGPALLVAAFYLDNKADENLSRARSVLSEAKEKAEEMTNLISALKGIRKISGLFETAIQNFRGYFQEAIERLDSLVENKGKNFREYSEKEKKLVHTTILFAEVQKKLLETPLLDENGAIRSDAPDVLKLADTFLLERK